jgi:hypothetical protein
MARPTAPGVVLALALAAPLSMAAAPAQEIITRQTALSRCAPLRVVEQEDVPPGSAIAVSADGRWLALYFHTPRGAEITIRDRDTSEVHRIELAPASVPPGITWRITDADFSPGGDVFAVLSTGKLWAFSTATGETLYEIGLDSEQLAVAKYPGQLALGGDKLALVFWPAESYLAAAGPKGLVNVRIFEARTGKLLNNLFLPIRTPDAWTRTALSPDAERLAVLMRPTRWPGKARLAVYAVRDGALIWEKKIGAEDLAWSADVRELLVLGSELRWLDASNGKELRKAERKTRFSESQKLRVSDPVNIATGFFLRYNPWKRSLDMSDFRDPQFRLWRLDSGKAACEILLDPSVRADAWPTARREIIALEETYDVKPQLRILRAARIVTYRIE